MITTMLVYALCILLGVYLGRMDHRRQQRKKGKEYIPAGLVDSIPSLQTEIHFRRPLVGRSKRMGNR